MRSLLFVGLDNGSDRPVREILDQIAEVGLQENKWIRNDLIMIS